MPPKYAAFSEFKICRAGEDNTEVICAAIRELRVLFAWPWVRL